MKNLEMMKNEAIEMLKNDDELFVDMVNELDSWNGYADGFRAYDMYMIDELFYDCKVSDFLDKLAGGFDHNDEYFIDSIYGIDSTNDITEHYRANVWEDELLENILENADNLYFFNDEFEELIEDINSYDAEAEEAVEVA